MVGRSGIDPRGVGDPLGLPRYEIVETVRWLVAVPRIAGASLVLDLGQAVLLDSVASAEKWTIGADLVEAGPERFGGGVGNHDHVLACRLHGVGDLLHLDAVDLDERK